MVNLPPVEPLLGLVPSLIYSGRRVRVIFNTLHFRPPTETFHEFLVNVVLWTLGERWWKNQVGMKEEDRHVVVKWKYDFERSAKRAMESGRLEQGSSVVYTAAPTGPSWALLSLGYDLFCLQTANRLPAVFVERLRRDRSFQGVRYEIAVAAIVARAGFEIEFVSPAKEEHTKNCEFVGTHRQTGCKVAVKAKSRHREGVLNEKGTFQPVEDSTWIYKRIKEATKQTKGDCPSMLFIDINLPLSPGIAPDERPWARDLEAAFAQLDKFGSTSASVLNAIIVTNLSHHYHAAPSESLRAEWGVFLSPGGRTPLDSDTLQALLASLERCNNIPEEI